VSGLTALYVFGAACGLLAAAYGALELQPSSAMASLLGWDRWSGWSGGSQDSQRRRIINVQDVGLFFYVTWPVTIPWYAWRSRGRAGWGLAARLYAIALVGQLGFILGATLRYLLGP
jgi:hypothetical protein